MIQVRFVEPVTDPKWNAWNERADRETSSLIAGPHRKIKESLYKEAQSWIVSTFHGKCAYCEVRLDVCQHKGDLDHYRPKSRVTDQHGRLVVIRGAAHPGYFWLAYRWWNLLPSCISCNRPSIGEDGVRRGKWDRFPVAGPYAFTCLDDLTREKPLLLNPYEDDPDKHLSFDVETGMVTHKTERGRMTIHTLGLNREGLVDARLRVIQWVQSLFADYMKAISRMNRDEADRLLAELRKYQKGIEPFAAAGRSMILVLKRDASLRRL